MNSSDSFQEPPHEAPELSGSSNKQKHGPFTRWLLQGIPEMEGPHEKEGQHITHPWWKVMCLTGVDYFSTLGYQPGIAAIAAGALSPFATLFLVLLTLFGALPMYRRVAQESPHGDGSISMLRDLLPWWQGKLFVLCLIGFVATGFVITITLSAADATKHVIENPFAPHWLHGHEIGVTIFLIALLGAVFLKGFNEAIGIAVVIVVAYIGLNFVVLGRGLYEIANHPEYLGNWRATLNAGFPNPLLMLSGALLAFPSLALGLSGFETGVVVMPLVKGNPDDSQARPLGRIRNTHKLLTTAALLMSVLLIASSIVTTLCIPPEAFREATKTAELEKLSTALGRPLDPDLIGQASGRALAYLAHHLLGRGFGTAYDVATIVILWFAGASAMAGLLNIVPRYLPRYGMAPEWARANRPLVLIFTAICFLVTVIFKASVEAQAAAYATGVLALMTSATIAVTLSAKRAGQVKAMWGFGLVTAIFIYTTIYNIWLGPDGLRIALIFIGAVIVVSLISRVSRTTELRVERVELDETAQRFIDEVGDRPIRIIANKREVGDAREYALKEDLQREDSHIPASFPILFLEVDVTDASEFSSVLQVKGVDVDGYRVLRAQSSTVPNAIAAFLLHLRNITGKKPHAYFNWSEGNPIVFMMRYLLFGEGDTAPVTREVLRKAEPDVARRPMIHVDG
jgi:steroid 5-alpha reductase family enzyme